ncbi:SH3 domain-containing protein [Thermodesulfobium acidiphilum]|uniref:SH3 domain-containing protein n=2 Tax=Thermodesulfobium acidiphilum TaxID=1794699 RepID=A0A2R4VZ53_THEAF|nr:SH3 domain-containing protein [Thermodesulfobium acidiphilum]
MINMINIKRFILLLVLWAFLVSSAYAAAFTPDGNLVGNNIPVRSGPGTSFKIIKIINQVTPIQSIEKQGDWYKVKFQDNSEGWVIGYFVALTKQAPGSIITFDKLKDIKALGIQNENDVWAATSFGIFLIESTTKVVPYNDGYPLGYEVEKFYFDNNNVYALFKKGDNDRKIMYLKGKKWVGLDTKFEYNTVYYQGDSYFWLGGKNGIELWDLKGPKLVSSFPEKEYHAFSSVLSIYRDSNDLWVGTEKGLYMLDLKTNKITTYSEKNHLIMGAFTLILGDKDRIYAVSRETNMLGLNISCALNIYDKKTHKWINYLPADYPPGITSYPWIEKGIITDDGAWFSVFQEQSTLITGYGVVHYISKDNKFKDYYVPKIYSDSIMGFVYQKGKLYMMSPKGVLTYNEATGDFGKITKADGLLDNDIKALAVYGNTLWIGGPQGITRYNLEK